MPYLLQNVVVLVVSVFKKKTCYFMNNMKVKITCINYYYNSIIIINTKNILLFNEEFYIIYLFCKSGNIEQLHDLINYHILRYLDFNN